MNDIYDILNESEESKEVEVILWRYGKRYVERMSRSQARFLEDDGQCSVEFIDGKRLY